MYLDSFHHAERHQVTITAEQASRFAKEIVFADFIKIRPEPENVLSV